MKLLLPLFIFAALVPGARAQIAAPDSVGHEGVMIGPV